MAQEGTCSAGPGGTRRGGVRRLPVRLRLSPARLLAPRRGVMGVALDEFAQLIARDDARIDLARACLMIAQDAYPELDVERYLGDIERMAIRLRASLPTKVTPEERVVALNKFLYEDQGFWGKADDYNDPRNSYLHEVSEI